MKLILQLQEHSIHHTKNSTKLAIHKSNLNQATIPEPQPLKYKRKMLLSKIFYSMYAPILIEHLNEPENEVNPVLVDATLKNAAPCEMVIILDAFT